MYWIIYPRDSLFLVDDLGILESMVSEIEEQAVKLRAESIAEGTLAESFPVPYVSWSELADILSSRACLELGRSTYEVAPDDQPAAVNLSMQFGQIERFGGRLKPFTEYLAGIVNENNSVAVVSRQSSRLEELSMSTNHKSTLVAPSIRGRQSLRRLEPWVVHFSLPISGVLRLGTPGSLANARVPALNLPKWHPVPAPRRLDRPCGLRTW